MLVVYSPSSYTVEQDDRLIRFLNEFIVLLLLLEFKEAVGLLTNPKKSIPKINQENFGKEARGYSHLPPIR